MADTITVRGLNRATLARQFLLERADVSVQQCIERLVALQAQLPRPPFIGVWTRMRSFAADDLRRLFHTREVVRATTLRGTLHVLTAPDYLRFRGVLQPMLTGGMLGILRGRAEGLDLDTLHDAARKFFKAGPHTFEEVRDHLVEAVGHPDERAMGYAARMVLPLVMVPTHDAWSFPTSSQFTLAEEWLGSAPDENDDPRELVRRYLAAFGPATPTDAQRWSGMPKLRDAFEALRPELITLRCGRRELFDLPDSPRPGEDTNAPVRFLPEFDNILLGHDDRSRIIDDAHKPAVYLPGLRVAPTFLVDGMVAGTWKAEQKKKVATLHITPFDKLTKATQQQLEEEGEALLALLEPEAKAREVRIERG